MAKTIYLSGPVSLGGTCTEEQIKSFTLVFTGHAQRLRLKGYDVINPCECDPQETWEDYMKIHIPSVCRCDVVGCLPRWLESPGSVLEVFIATQLKIPVMDIHEIGYG